MVMCLTKLTLYFDFQCVNIYVSRTLMQCAMINLRC